MTLIWRVGYAATMSVAFVMGLGSPQQRPVFEAGARAVLVDCTVLSHGRPVTALTARDFQLRDDGVVQHAELVEASLVPLDVSLLVDVSGSVTIGQRARYWASLGAAQALLRPADRLGLTTFGEVVHEEWPLTPVPVAIGPVPSPQRHLTRLFDALAQASMRPALPGRIHVILVFTDGMENRSVTSAAALAAVVERSDARLFVMLTGGSAVKALPQVVSIGRGDVFKTDRLDDALRRVMTSIDSTYLLVFQPAGVSASGWHHLDVSVTRPGALTVHARRWYFGG